MLKITGPDKELKAIAKTFSKAKGVSFEFTDDGSDEGKPIQQHSDDEDELELDKPHGEDVPLDKPNRKKAK